MLLAVGLFVRLQVEETPVFAARTPSRPPQRLPLLEVLRDHPRVLAARASGVGLAAFVAQATLTTFVLAYGVQAGHARQTVLNALTISSALAVVGILAWSALSDRSAARPVVLTGAVAMAVFGFVLFPLVDSGSAVLLMLALVIGQAVIHPMMYGPLAALYTELFSTENRYTGASLGYQLAGLGAGFAPLLFAEIAAALRRRTRPRSRGSIAAFCVLTVVCVLALKETSRQDLADGAVPEPAPEGRPDAHEGTAVRVAGCGGRGCRPAAPRWSSMDQSITYAELAVRVTKTGRTAGRRGVGRATGSATSGRTTRPSSRRCSPTHLLGAIFVPLNFRLTAPEWPTMLADSGGAGLLVHAPDVRRRAAR